MTNKKPPVTDDPPMNLLTQWRQLADRYASEDDPNEAELIIDDLTASIQANIPAPPKSLADELRTVADIIGSDFDAEAQRLDTLADRAEIIKQELGDSEDARAGLGEQVNRLCEDLKRVTGERGEARDKLDNLKFNTLEGKTAIGWMENAKAASAEVERLRKELGEERGKVHESSQLEDDAVSLSYWLADNLGEHVDDQDNETLTATVRRFVDQETTRLTRERDEFMGDMISSEVKQARLESDLPAPEDEFEDPLRGPIASWMDGYVTATIFEAGKPPLVEVNYLPAPDPDAFAAAIKAAARYTKAGADE